MNIGLFFGSFNPVHNGHLMMANYLCQVTDLKQVWMVVSPQNPFKEKSTLLRERERLHLLHLAIDDNPRLRASDIEFNLPRPSYTIDTLTYLSEKYPKHRFALIMGSDNLATLHKWKNYEQILEQHTIYVYARMGSGEHPFPHHPHIRIVEFPFLDISATFIRESIAKGLSMQYFLPEKVWQYIDENNLYRKSK